jgi:superoxide dismutase, Cu-Zn family
LNSIIINCNKELILKMIYATAHLKGNHLAPQLIGKVDFIPWHSGTLVKVEVLNLPPTKPPVGDEPPVGPFGFHIHEGKECGFETSDLTFEVAGQHFNPTDMPHPFHVGDLPSLLANNGYAFMIVFTNRFKPEDIIERAIIIHRNPDDYRTQPTGAAGDRIACGIIEKI